MPGRFLPNPADVPPAAADYLAGQLGIPDPSVLKRYAQRLKTHCEHASETPATPGYRDFSDPAAAGELREFLAGRAWTSAEGSAALFAQAVGGCWSRGCCCRASVLARLVSAVREEAAGRLHMMLADAAAPAGPGLPGWLLEQPVEASQRQALFPRQPHQLGRGLLLRRLLDWLHVRHVAQCRAHHGTFPAEPRLSRSGRKHR